MALSGNNVAPLARAGQIVESEARPTYYLGTENTSRGKGQAAAMDNGTLYCLGTENTSRSEGTVPLPEEGPQSSAL